MSLLEVENVTKRFGSLVAVSDVSMTVEPGELRAMIGPNGAGKTTFFNMISGFFAPTLRHDHVRRPGRHRLCRRTSGSWRGMARTFQITEIFPELTVRENVRIARRSRAAAIACGPWHRRAESANVGARVDEMLQLTGLDRQGRPPRRRALRMATSAPPRSRWRWRSSRASCCSTSRPPAWATRRPTRSRS